MKYIRSHHWHWTRQLNHTTKDINEVTCEIDIWWKLKCEANKKRRWHLWPGSKDELLHPLVDFGVNLALHQFVHFLQSFFSEQISWVERRKWRLQFGECNICGTATHHCNSSKYIFKLGKMNLTVWTNTSDNLHKYIWQMYFKVWQMWLGECNILGTALQAAQLECNAPLCAAVGALPSL